MLAEQNTGGEEASAESRSTAVPYVLGNPVEACGVSSTRSEIYDTKDCLLANALRALKAPKIKGRLAALPLAEVECDGTEAVITLIISFSCLC